MVADVNVVSSTVWCLPQWDSCTRTFQNSCCLLTPTLAAATHLLLLSIANATRRYEATPRKRTAKETTHRYKVRLLLWAKYQLIVFSGPGAFGPVCSALMFFCVFTFFVPVSSHETWQFRLLLLIFSNVNVTEVSYTPQVSGGNGSIAWTVGDKTKRNRGMCPEHNRYCRCCKDM